MPNYTLPQWLDPSAAQGYGALAGEASRAALTAQLQREKMAQDAAQSSMEMQQKSQQIAAENAQQQQQYQQSFQANQAALAQQHEVEQQKLAITNAYQQQQIALRNDAVNVQRDKLNNQIAQAAKQHDSIQKYQKSKLPIDQGGEGLTDEEAFSKYVLPGMSANEAGKAITQSNFKPGTVIPIQGSENQALVQVSPGHNQVITLPQKDANIPSTVNILRDDKGNIIQDEVIGPNGKRHYVTPHSSSSSIPTTVQEKINKAMGITPDQPVSTMVDNPKPAKNEVIRVVNGRAAVFDSSTKQFIRWADNKAADAK
jgi:hypothetical protein